MSYRRPGPDEHKKLITLGEAIEVMAQAHKEDAIFYLDKGENQIKIRTWYTNGDFAGDDYYTIPAKVASKLIPMTEGIPQMGYTSQSERTLFQRHRDQYYEGLQTAREIREAKEEEAKKEALYQKGIIDANNGLGE